MHKLLADYRSVAFYAKKKIETKTLNDEKV